MIRVLFPDNMGPEQPHSYKVTRRVHVTRVTRPQSCLEISEQIFKILDTATGHVSLIIIDKILLV